MKDSKNSLTKSRGILYKKIIDIVDDYYVVKIPPRSIDASVKKHLLNNLEAKVYGKSCFKIRCRYLIC